MTKPNDHLFLSVTCGLIAACLFAVAWLQPEGQRIAAFIGISGVLVLCGFLAWRTRGRWVLVLVAAALASHACAHPAPRLIAHAPRVVLVAPSAPRCEPLRVEFTDGHANTWQVCWTFPAAPVDDAGNEAAR